MDKENKERPLRLFIAVRLPDELKSVLERWREAHQHLYPFKKWTHREDYHITVQFLGDVEPERVPAIAEKLKSIASQFRPFELGFGKAGVFGAEASPRVLWAGVIDYKNGLAELQEKVTDAMETLGFAKESRPYRPHITIARKYAGNQGFQLASMPPLLQQTAASEQGDDMATWIADEFVLFSTHLHEKPMYEILESFRMEYS
ncbi:MULTISPECIES: RNA 2',3'-cyclic phosphodiesterase [Paenibacillus]|uniref:RNA 2',3'-cyclic phosphodiesterase n=1 Tax=Paenibacillus cookii TaxID=157839 RepID=A0ABQ4LX84_9BACL|nr:RNA 2',3'-cyclic phosphodiesterase [Paenibacillus cookii]GIO67862.1 RNA 2',3'-cyclic phosphodiesterase [Paenibacillus cookii]